MATRAQKTFSSNPSYQRIFDTTAQAFTNAWVDIGVENNSKSATGVTVYLKATVGTSTNMSLRVLGKYRTEKQALYAQANELKDRLNFHYNDETEHTSGVQANITTVNAVDDPSFVALVAAELASYALSDADAEAGGPAYHPAAETNEASLASEVAPTTYALAATRLADIVAKLLIHVADGGGTPHTTGDNPPVFDPGDQEYVLPILTESSSDVKVEDEYYEFNVDANQNVIIDIPLNGVVPFIQFQVKDNAGGTGTIDSMVVMYRED